MMTTRTTVLQDIKRDLEALLYRVNVALGEMGEPPRESPRGPHRPPIEVPQTYPPELDFRDDPEGLRNELLSMYGLVSDISANVSALEPSDLYKKLCLFASKARLLQTQTVEGSREWETAVGTIRTLTRVASTTRVGYVYGLSAAHNTDWGQMYMNSIKE